MESKGIIDSSSSKGKEKECCVMELTVEDTRKIINALSREQLIEIVHEFATDHRHVRQQVRSIAEENKDLRKLFVRGLSQQTNEETLNATFSAFGELDECRVIMDRRSGKSKGYGFVTFKDIEGALNALNEPSKRVDGRMTVSHFAEAGFQSSLADVSGRKIYVRNVPVGMEAGPLVTFFSQYGQIQEGPLGFDKQSGRSKGSALFIFEKVEAAQRAVEEPIKTIDNGHQIYCKIADEGQMATPKTVNYRSKANRSRVHTHQLNQPSTEPDVIPGEGYNGNPVIEVNQGWNPGGLTIEQGWPEQNNGVYGYNANYYHQIYQMPPVLYPYSAPEDGVYGWGATPMYPYRVPEDGGYGYGWRQPAGEYGFTDAAHAAQPP